MDLTAHEAANIRFRGTRYAYDRLEVDRFLSKVVAALDAHEAALARAQARIEKLEKAEARLPRFLARAAAPDPHRSAPESFEEWRSELAIAAETEHLRSLAREEARMIRALAAVKAAEEIDLLTASARADALRMTQRAAQLATQTEEAAHHRAGEIMEAASLPTGPEDLHALNERIVHLRSTIAAMQDRLGSISATGADEGHTSADGTPAEIIELDLRDEAEPTEPKTPRKRRPAPATKRAATKRGATKQAATKQGATKQAARKKAPAKQAAGKRAVTKSGTAKTGTAKKRAGVPSTADLEAKLSELQSKLTAD